MTTTSETNMLHYDFCLPDDLNDKLKKAVILLDQVRFKLAYEKKVYGRLRE